MGITILHRPLLRIVGKGVKYIWHVNNDGLHAFHGYMLLVLEIHGKTLFIITI